MSCAQAFLSYSHADAAAATRLRDELLRAGIDVFKDDASLRSGDRWLDRLQKAVAECGAFIVLVGRDGGQRWVGAEVEVALNRHYSARDGAARLPIHPILLPEAAPEALPPFLALFQAERWSAGPLPEGLVGALLAGTQRIDERPRFEACPFVGLSTFAQSDAELFFGRRAETLEALACLGDQLMTDPGRLHAGGGAGYVRWLQIEGHSGSGKSSLVHAGLLPMVERGALWPRTGFPDWRVLGPMKPGRKPVERLAEALERGLKAPHEPRDMGDRTRRLESDARALAHAIRDGKRDGLAFLLVIDQFEELYTLAESDQRSAFDACLASALADADCPLFVVATVRSDFLDRIEALPRLSAIYNDRCKRYLLPAITPQGLRDAIELPARLAGLDVSEVTAVMLREAHDEPGALPLVENALTQLWHGREGRRLSGKVYGDRGGLAGMLRQGADALLERIDAAVPKGRIGALELLLGLARYDPGGRHTRRRVTRAEAVQAAGNGDDAAGERVLQMLSGERPDERPSDARGDDLRLVTTGVEGDTPYVDLIHETLLRARRRAGDGAAEPYWPALYEYLDKNRDREMLRQQLALQIERWQDSGLLMRPWRLARWGQLPELRRIRLKRGSVEGRYLAWSWRKVAVQAVLLVAVAGWTVHAWDPLARAAYLTLVPAWYLGVRHVPETVEIPPLAQGKTFTMGCKPGRDVDAGRSCPADEPQREVPMPAPCAMGKYEVTNLQYNWYLWEKAGKGFSLDDERFTRPLRHPVVEVSWHDARDYARWLSAKTGRTYRLPTEAEWEYAARGGLEAKYPWGNEPPQGRANCFNCGDGYSGKSTTPVGTYARNKYRLHDMAGNVWEWVEDAYTEGGASRVLRGGSWLGEGGDLRAAIRYVNPPVGRSDLIGFRLCRSSPIEPPPTAPPATGSPNR